MFPPYAVQYVWENIRWFKGRLQNYFPHSGGVRYFQRLKLLESRTP
jgi:hypothetical protein